MRKALSKAEVARRQAQSKRDVERVKAYKPTNKGNVVRAADNARRA